MNFPPSTLDVMWPDFCMACACCHSFCALPCVAAPLCLDHTVSSISSICSDSLSLPSLPHTCLSPEGRNLKTFHLRPSVLRVSHSLYIVHCEFLHQFSCTAEESFPEQNADLWVYQKVTRGHCIAMFLGQNSAVWYSPRPIAYLVLALWPPEQCQIWVSSHRVGLKSNQTVGDYSQQCFCH